MSDTDNSQAVMMPGLAEGPSIPKDIVKESDSPEKAPEPKRADDDVNPRAMLVFGPQWKNENTEFESGVEFKPRMHEISHTDPVANATGPAYWSTPTNPYNV